MSFQFTRERKRNGLAFNSSLTYRLKPTGPFPKEGQHDDETNGYPGDENRKPMKSLVKKAGDDTLGDNNYDLD